MGTRVLVTDEHEVMRASLKSVLQGDSRYEVCGEASLFLYNQIKAPVHSQSAGSLMSLWFLGTLCCGIGIFFLYKAFVRKAFRAVNVGKAMANARPRWLARSLSFLLGLTFIALGVGIVISLLKHA